MMNADDVHLTGIVSMFIASKYVDYYPLKMNIVHEMIAHKSFAQESIKAKEREIMRTIKFNITFPTMLTFLENIIETFSFSKRSTMKDCHWKTIDRIKRLCIYNAKMVQYEYRMLEYS